ncbi:Ligand-binding SRPBCC domain-containing protein [Malonomonas rubra DSM 5091]|uniref:Ligand-binding SRPBCC domain-containing protein n=1 Tax=Malonomonas rubra DSM 5091 TaxID=1122189 RepID=A0A1M6G1J7_MALRU|nr:SRPBCC family protein [Malonomonas rubra]SHJ03789.1 Ligand-binding SRPBCC domain-containing protein [Malonomonas rubra DSM 5091]
MHFLEKEIILNVSQEKLWDFMATPANLNELTPPELYFQIVSDLPDRMYNGLMIEYRIRIPLFGNWRWLTEIKHIRDGEYFVDEQRIGPYRLWHHQHLLEPAGEKQTRMIDRVSYRLPFGPFGLLVHELRVKQMLEEIFDYRSKRLQELFS